MAVAAAEADQLIDEEVCGGGGKDDCAGWVGCSGWLYCVDDGARVLNRARSGVTVRKLGWLLPMAGLDVVVGLVGFCVDHEKDGVFGVLDELLTVAVALEDAMIDGVSSQLGKPLLLLVDDADMPPLPFTRASKSSSFPPAVLSNVVPVTPPNARKSSLGPAVPAFVVPDNSCSFLVCSSSTLLDRFLISSMNVWNWRRSSSGPRLMLHRIGRMSIATKSASAFSPTMRSTLSAAIMTAGSFVLIALIRGTIFSCMVYLSNALDEDDFFLFSISPLRPSSAAASVEPPQRMTKACKPRTLIARLFVLLKTMATTGKSSFLMVLKSRTGRIDGSILSAASTIEGVGHSIAANITGRISDDEYGQYWGLGFGLQRTGQTYRP